MNVNLKNGTALAVALLLAACNNNETSAKPTEASSAVETTASFSTMGNIPAPDARELAEFKAATRALYDLKEKAFAEGKVDPIVKRFYAENVVSVGPEGKPVLGRAALTKGYEAVVPASNVKVESINTFVKGDVGWDWANFYVTPKDPNSKEKPFSFVILFLWTKMDGKWVSAGDAYVVGSFPKQGTGDANDPN
jgi:ketosteroid isomerase-like protein